MCGHVWYVGSRENMWVVRECGEHEWGDKGKVAKQAKERVSGQGMMSGEGRRSEVSGEG